MTNINLFAQIPFRLYNHTNSILDEHSLYSLAIDSNQVVWAGSYSNIFRYINGSWTSANTILTADSLTGYITNIEISNSGTVWFNQEKYKYSLENRLFSYNNKTLVPFRGVDTFGYEIENIFVDESNIPWFTLSYVGIQNGYLGYRELGTIEKDTLKLFYHKTPSLGSELIKVKDTVYIALWTNSILKVCTKDYSETVVEVNGWRPSYLWKDGNEVILGGTKISLLYGNNPGSFSKIDSFLAPNNEQVTSFIRENASTFWIGTDKGHLLKCSNNFLEIAQYYEEATITELSIDSRGNKWMLLKDKGIGVYNKDGIVKVRDEQIGLPANIKLFQNYPNPFNPSTIISYSIPKSENVQIKVYDLLGKEIQMLINRYQTVGTYELIFDGSLLPSGIYFCKIICGNFSDTKKMILLK